MPIFYNMKTTHFGIQFYYGDFELVGFSSPVAMIQWVSDLPPGDDLHIRGPATVVDSKVYTRDCGIFEFEDFTPFFPAERAEKETLRYVYDPEAV